MTRVAIVGTGFWGAKLAEAVDRSSLELAACYSRNPENRAAFARWTFRPRVLVDVSNVELATTVLGAKVSFPILVAPTAFHRLAHTEGEVATAKGVLATGTTMVVSTIASVRLEDVAVRGTHPHQ